MQYQEIVNILINLLEIIICLWQNICKTQSKNIPLCIIYHEMIYIVKNYTVATNLNLKTTCSKTENHSFAMEYCPYHVIMYPIGPHKGILCQYWEIMICSEKSINEMVLRISSWHFSYSADKVSVVQWNSVHSFK